MKENSMPENEKKKFVKVTKYLQVKALYAGYFDDILLSFESFTF